MTTDSTDLARELVKKALYGDADIAPDDEDAFTATFGGMVRALSAALRSARPGSVESELTLDVDIARGFPDGSRDLSTFEAIETALDRAGAPAQDGNRWLTLPERIAALSQVSGRETVIEEIEYLRKLHGDDNLMDGDFEGALHRIRALSHPAGRTEGWRDLATVPKTGHFIGLGDRDIPEIWSATVYARALAGGTDRALQDQAKAVRLWAPIPAVPSPNKGGE